jgi:hypothetical protein
MTDKNIQEAEVGSGTKVTDVKQSEKRAQLTLKSIQLRLKQEKERAALQAQKKSLSVKEEIEESFSPSQIAALKAEYSKINGIDPASETYKKLIAMLDRLDLKSLQSLAGAEIKFVSKLAQNRVARKNMKEEVQLDELSNEKLADYKKKAGADASAADKAGDMKKGNKRFSGIMKATKKQFANDDKKSMSEASQKVDSLVTDALKIMKGSELKDAVQALKTVLGDREYNDRRGHYNFYVKQLVDMYGKKANEELDIELDEVLSKDATAGDFIHDFVNSDNPKFAGKSKEKRKQMALAAYYAKQKNEELSPKQKAIDKNKNGKIDGFDLSHLRKKTEELSPKQKALDKNKNGKIDGSDLAKLRNKSVSESDAAYGASLRAKEEKRKMNSISSADKSKLSAVVAMLNKEKKKQPQGADFAAQRRKERMASNGRMDEQEMSDGDKSSMALRALVAKKKLQQTSGKNKSQAFIDKMVNRSKLLNQPKSDDEYTRKVVQHLKKKYNEETVNEKSEYEVYHKDYSGAVQTAIKQAEKRGYEVDMDDWHDKVATGPKKPSSGKTNSFSINLMKDGKPSKKKLQMQVYNMDNQKYELNMYIEEVEISEAGPGLWANIQAKRQRIKAGSNERMRKPGEKGAPESDALDKARGKNEAASPAQQAAIAIAMKKDGKKPKDMEESDAYDKNVKPSDKPHDKEAAAKRAKLAALAARKKMSEGLMDKIKAMKRGMQAKDKADDHWDKAGDPKNPDAKKDLKKAVRYTNLLNKEEVVVEARKKTLKDMKKKVKTEETPNGSVVKKGEALTGKREPIEINPELKEPAR